jgi:hypothetical protein
MKVIGGKILAEEIPEKVFKFRVLESGNQYYYYEYTNREDNVY